MLNYKDMQFKHKEDCNSKDSKNITKQHIVYQERVGIVEYDAYCKECGCFLYHFSYGHYEMY